MSQKNLASLNEIHESDKKIDTIERRQMSNATDFAQTSATSVTSVTLLHVHFPCFDTCVDIR